MNVSGVSSAISSQSNTYQSAAQQLAAFQTISSDVNVRLSLGTAMATSGYLTPLQQAWLNLRESLATNDTLVQGTGDLSSAKSALDSYMRLLPSSDLYMSDLTTPSQAFMSDLQTMSAAINAGDLTGAQTSFAKAQVDQPMGVASAIAQAGLMGDPNEQARVTMEAVANTAGYLVSIGYTQSNADIEANAMMVGGLTETPAGMSVQNPNQEAQVEQQSTAISVLDSASAPTSNQFSATAEMAMYRVYESLYASDPYALKDSNMNAYIERADALSQLLGTSNEHSSSSLAASTIQVSV